MDIYLVRHAWAGDRGDPRWPDDDLRPLTDAGGKRFEKMALKLAERGVAPEVIAASPLVRCVQTAEILAAATSCRPEVVELDALRPGSDLKAMMLWTSRQLDKHKYKQIAWVGHSPDVDRLAARLIGATDGLLRFAKGSVAAIQFNDTLEIGAGELRWLVTAKILGC